MKLNKSTLQFKVNDWFKYTDEYIEMLIVQDEIHYRAYQIRYEADLKSISASGRFRLATENEIRKEKLRFLFIETEKYQED
jgi:hypothetical protein